VTFSRLKHQGPWSDSEGANNGSGIFCLHLPSHRHENMNKGSNSGNFWRDSEVLEFYFVIKMPKVAGIGALVHKFHIGWWPTDAKTALQTGRD
jgi:hypothetical protein